MVLIILGFVAVTASTTAQQVTTLVQFTRQIFTNGLVMFAGRMGVGIIVCLCSLQCSGQEVQVFGFATKWKYEPSGTNPPANWMSLDYDDSYWLQGTGAFSAFSTENLLGLAQINYGTAIYNPFPIPGILPSHYFRMRFLFPYPQTNMTLVASNLIDDGAVIYLNGIELSRIAMPTGAVDHTTVATRDNDVSSRGADVIEFARPTQLQGENLLAVEVHQGSSFSLDTVFAMSLSARFPLRITILSHPESQSLWENSNVVFRVDAVGFPMSYQWQHDGTNIPGATGSIYTISRVSTRDEGQYSVIITNEFESVTSRVAVLNVFTDRVGPQLLSAVVREINQTNSILLQFNETVPNQFSTDKRTVDPANYRLTVCGTTNTVPITNVTASGTLVLLRVGNTNWNIDGCYILTVNNVPDLRGNVIAPDSQVAVAWPLHLNLLASDAEWSFHASAVFDPGIFDEDWTSTNYVEGSWWARGNGIFYGGPASVPQCLGSPQTPVGFQPEPMLFRTTFNWPTNLGSTAQLEPDVIGDDGAVLYLNGVEIWRSNVPAAVTRLSSASRSAATIATPTCVTNISVAVTNLLPGTNWLAAGTVQPVSDFASDVVFGLRLSAIVLVSAPIQESPIPTLSLALNGPDAVRLWWAGGGYALESATNLTDSSASYPVGPWQQVTNMSNPYTNSLAAPARFFRLKR